MPVFLPRRLFVGFLLASVRLTAAVDLVDAPAADAFPLVSAGQTAVFILPADAPAVVRIAARDFAADVERVTGVRPAMADTPPVDAAIPRVHIALDPALADRWEAFQLSATPTELTVAGADPRALAYGLYELSRRIGVSPWQWWADVPVAPRNELHLSIGTEPVDAPAVKYRGIFLNDEGWGLVPWAAKTHAPDADNLGPETYARIFELLLRLRANSIWPAMHPGTTPFHRMPGNAATADRYAVVVGSSHAEPMLRNNVGEWTQDPHLYNYVDHPDIVLKYWEDRVAERTSGESLFTLGMRGIHDSGMVGADTQAERLATWEKIFADQRDLLARHLGDGDPTNVAQIFVPYKEVLPDYDAGLQVPDDVTIVWPDDNFGYMRRYATPAERERAGGLGVYYHLSYLGSPMAWLWVDSMPTALIWSEMTRAYEQGARTVWIGNVGDLKNTELATEFFLDLAWHADRTSPDAAQRYLHDRAARDFGANPADAIASIWRRHQHLAMARKPEHLSWNLPRQPYQPTALTDAEIAERLTAYTLLAADVARSARALPDDAQGAFFQLVAFPALSASAANHHYFAAELARRFRARGNPSAAGTAWEESVNATDRIEKLNTHYNETVADGKWRRIVMPLGLPPGSWPSFRLPPIPPLDDEAALRLQPAPEPAVAWEQTAPPTDARPGDFIERGGVVSIIPAHFTDQRPQAEGAAWQIVPGLGRSGSAVTILPSTAPITDDDAPRLSYRFHVFTGGNATVHVRLLPTFPIDATPGAALRLAIALDDGAPIAAAVTVGFDPGSAAWKERVLTNATATTVTLPAPLAPGWHTLHLVGVDAGVVVDKIVIDLGGLTPSYDGPPETRLP